MMDVWTDPVLGELTHRFSKHFGSARRVSIAWAPGRVNLIGEHIDYHNLPVLPIAMQRGTFVTFRPRADNEIHIISSDRRFRRRRFAIRKHIRAYKTGDWGNYVKAAAQAVAERYGVTTGFDGLVHSTTPVASGLSSSSALVIGTALALLDASAADARPFDLMETLAVGERYVGLNGGGMDQAAILGARNGSAACISFAPLRLEIVPIPDDWRFVVASSLAAAAKTGVALETYNRRASESREALDLMLEHMGVRGTVDGYRGLIDEFGPGELLEAGATQLPEPLLSRFRHVVTETDRVLDAVRAMERADLAAFGPLLSDSHRSLRDDYEVSTLALDELTEVAVSAGAAGARLTGAGLGGCIVAVCRAGATESVLHALRDRFYRPRGLTGDLNDVLFVAKPSGGASVRRL